MMKDYLKQKAEENGVTFDEMNDRWSNPIIKYHEDIEDRYLDSWGNNGDIDCPYIYKIGVLVISDGNKREWVKVFIGMQRDEQSEPYFLGLVKFPEGENEDYERSIERIFTAWRNAGW